MPFVRWVSENFQILLTDVGIVGSLLFTGFQMRSEAKTRRVANVLAATSNHREIWSSVFRNPELARVLDPKATTQKKPISDSEEVFVILVILHLASVFTAQKDHLIVKEEGLRRDVFDFFSRPIPAAVWEKMKVLYNDDFVAYVEDCRNWK